MFQKNIERDIKGVIKVAQTSEDHIYQELDEYVVTKELHKHLSKFYENYQKGITGQTDKMGVWISGFFGSGKSHFLKILAYLLENKQVKDKRAIEFFQEKVQDPLVYANMQRAAKTETEVILFNIDSESALDNKSKEDAILRVFMKVFYNHRGYYGDHAGVAEMEKYLDKKGVYGAFKEEFAQLAGESWESRRGTFYFDADYVVGALTKVTDMTKDSARNWFDNGVDDVEISIKKFSQEVNDYIETKAKDFHLVFLVDEIGQYIGDNRNLMLNLQTVAEDLGTYCQGKVWIMVTSQESIDSIIKVKGDDFSRIQGRFDTRLSLSSISVDEVIKRRILEKEDYIADKLKALYPEKSAILKNVVSFRESTADLRGYADDVEFAEVYPFIPYQFKLLQNVFEQVRKHGSSGKHLSEGERSMLSAFKEAALQFKEAEEGALIPFYAFYDTIKEFLNPSVSRVIDGAYENPALNDDEFHMNLLKVLFMIKYIKELPANIDNIATLMVMHIDEDKLELKEKISSSLRKLIGQTLIQKNGDLYTFLTDDEQDINREIKQVAVEEDVMKRELASYVFDDLYEGNRFRYSNVYLFPYAQKMDDKNHGSQNAPIGVHVLSPLSDHYHKSEQELMMMTSGTSDFIVKLGGNEWYIDEMEEVLKIEEYKKKRNITQLPESMQNIINNKTAEAKERRRRVKELLEEAIKQGTYFFNGDKADVKGSSVKEKFNNAFKLLVENVYTKLAYVKLHMENERELIPVLSLSDDQMTFDETDPNELAVQEVVDFITFQAELNKQVRVKLLYDRFQDKPYGWKQLDIAAMIAQQLKKQQIRIRYNANYLEPETDTNALVTVLTKTAEADKAIVLKRTKVDEKLLRTAKRISREVFNKTDLADDEDGLLKDIKTLIAHQVDEINALKARYEGRKYPGMSLLNKGLEYFGEFHNGLDNASFFAKLGEMEDDLADWEEDVTYVKSFFSTNQKDLFDQGLQALQTFKDNQVYLSGMDIEQTMDKLHAIIHEPIPYKQIKDIPELVHTLQKEMKRVIDEKKAGALKKVEEDYQSIKPFASQYGVKDETKQRFERYYSELKANIESFTDIYKVDAAISQSASFKSSMLKQINDDLERFKLKPPITIVDPPISPLTEVKEIEKVQVKQLVPITTLKTEEAVDEYIQMLSKKMKDIIRANKDIEITD